MLRCVLHIDPDSLRIEGFCQKAELIARNDCKSSFLLFDYTTTLMTLAVL